MNIKTFIWWIFAPLTDKRTYFEMKDFDRRSQRIFKRLQKERGEK